MDGTTKTRKVRNFLDRVAIEEAEIRARIREARLLVGLTQEQAADLAVVHKRTWENWERGVVEIPFKQMEVIAKVIGKPVEWLLHGDEYVSTSGFEAQLAAVREQLVQIQAILEKIQEGRDDET